MEKNDDAALKAMVSVADADIVQEGKDPIVAQQRKELAAAGAAAARARSAAGRACRLERSARCHSRSRFRS